MGDGMRHGVLGVTGKVSCCGNMTKLQLFQLETAGAGSGNVDDSKVMLVVQSWGAEVMETVVDKGTPISLPFLLELVHAGYEGTGDDGAVLGEYLEGAGDAGTTRIRETGWRGSWLARCALVNKEIPTVYLHHY